VNTHYEPKEEPVAKTPSKSDTSEIPVMILTNERTPFKAQQILMLYKAASMAQLAYMDGMHPETGEIVPLLVGLEPTENATQFKVYPLATLIDKLSDIPQYLVPDGQGGYMDYRVKEATDELPQPFGDEGTEKEGPAPEGQGSSDGDGGTLG